MKPLNLITKVSRYDSECIQGADLWDKKVFFNLVILFRLELYFKTFNRLATKYLSEILTQFLSAHSLRSESYGALGAKVSVRQEKCCLDLSFHTP